MNSNPHISYFRYEDYAQSANALFHFMKEEKFLKDILHNRVIIPRYCVENVEYLEIKKQDINFDKIAVLQKCFCDIPFHKLGDVFPLIGTGENFKKLTIPEKRDLEKNNTHFDYYGKFGIAFSKRWGEQHNLQPIHYLNEESHYVKEFSELISSALLEDDLPEQYVQDVVNRLSFIKPLRGIMARMIKRKRKNDTEVNIYKNFHDECEWRYVPESALLKSLGMEAVIANPKMVELHKEISKQLETEKYSSLWMDFKYDDIRCIIVPDIQTRINIIQEILKIPVDKFDLDKDVDLQKYILISKILVLDEIRRDW